MKKAGSGLNPLAGFFMKRVCVWPHAGRGQKTALREVTERKSRRADLNRWPADYESAALPAELRRQKNAHPLGVSNSGKEKKDQEPRKSGVKAPSASKCK